MAAGDELTLSYVAPFSKGLRARQEDIRRNHNSVSHDHHHIFIIIIIIITIITLLQYLHFQSKLEL